MATRGEYNKAQQKMLDDANQRAAKMEGWVKSPNRMVATEEAMRSYVNALDYWNPLWRDDNYARSTRWGGIIAFPGFQERFAGGSLPPNLGATPECGYPGFSGGGLEDQWEYFKPIRPGDTFRVWFNRPKIEDITSLDRKGPLTFRVTLSDNTHINQNNELVSTFKRLTTLAFYDKPQKVVPSEPETRYRYTKEELAYIEKMTLSEEIRGANVRYWEDVKTGDETKPIVLGPTTVWDTVSYAIGGGMNITPRREQLKVPREQRSLEGYYDATTGVSHLPIEPHFSDYVAQLPHAFQRPLSFLFMPLARSLLTRLVTNWIGDDGWLKALKFRYLAQTFIGDTVIGRGKVTNKRIENGEHLVDLTAWLENMRGHVSPAISATVKLMSRDVVQKWK